MVKMKVNLIHVKLFISANILNAPFCSALEISSFEARNVSLNEWQISPKTRIDVSSCIECGLKCKTLSNCTAIQFDKTNNICTLIDFSQYSTGLRKAWASSVMVGPWTAVDGEYGTNHFHTKKELYSWYALDLLVEFEIREIKILERNDPHAVKHNNAKLTESIEARVGNQSPLTLYPADGSLYIINDFCGVFDGPGVTGDVSSIVCKKPIVGRYVTLQRTNEKNTYMHWREVVLMMEPIVPAVSYAEIKLLLDIKAQPRPVCNSDVGYSECPESAPYAIKGGEICCNGKTIYSRLNFDSKDCNGNMIQCSSPPCINHGCQPYNCYLQDKILTGGNVERSYNH